MANEKLNGLTNKDVWIFTKQTPSFDTAFKSAKLFSEIPDIDNTNIENYFAENHNRYGIETDRHRALVISQFYGLLTKNPLYQKGGKYKKERVTEVFDMLNACVFGSEEYNTLKTEQILKIKIRAIIDTENNNVDWCILPVIFSYKVLKVLKDKYNIVDIQLDLFYTYVMSCSDYSEVDKAAEYILNNSSVTEHIDMFKDRSRFKGLLQNNIKLFNITADSICINENFDEYFNQNFMEKVDIDELNMQLSRDVDYIYFLTTYQGFDINLVERKANVTCDSHNLGLLKIKNNEISRNNDNDYVTKIDELMECNINADIVKDAYKTKPNPVTKGILNKYSKNPLIGKVAIKEADYKCENNNQHKTFISSNTKKQFMEAHHLIPINQQNAMWERFNVNIDCKENIVSLCPNCHRAIHYSRKDAKRELIESLYNAKKNNLISIGLNISLGELLDIYKV